MKYQAKKKVVCPGKIFVCVFIQFPRGKKKPLMHKFSISRLEVAFILAAFCTINNKLNFEPPLRLLEIGQTNKYIFTRPPPSLLEKIWTMFIGLIYDLFARPGEGMLFQFVHANGD